MLKRGASLDLMSQALADPGRRSMVNRLTQGPVSVAELAATMATSLATVRRQLRVLEASGLVSTAKVGRVEVCRVERVALAIAESWITKRLRWEQRLSRLGQLLAEWKEEG